MSAFFRAVFAPRNENDLVSGASDFVGHVGLWERAWLVEDGPFDGEWACALLEPRPAPFAWAPESDLRRIEESGEDVRQPRPQRFVKLVSDLPNANERGRTERRAFRFIRAESDANTSLRRLHEAQAVIARESGPLRVECGIDVCSAFLVGNRQNVVAACEQMAFVVLRYRIVPPGVKSLWRVWTPATGGLEPPKLCFVSRPISAHREHDETRRRNEVLGVDSVGGVHEGEVLLDAEKPEDGLRCRGVMQKHANHDREALRFVLKSVVECLCRALQETELRSQVLDQFGLRLLVAHTLRSVSVSRGKCHYLRPVERKCESREDAEVGVKLYAFQPSHAERPESVLMFQPSEFALNRYAASIEVAEPLRMPRDMREPTRPVGERENDLLALRSLHGDDGVTAARLALGVDALYVVALVHRDRFGLEAASADSIEQGCDEQRFMVTRGTRLPRKRQTRCGANRKVDLVPIEAATLARTDCAAVSPRGIGVGEPFAELASLADVAHPVRPSRNVGGIYRYVTSKIRVLRPERCGERVEARAQGGPVVAQLVSESVHRPHARAAADCFLQAGMLCDQRGDERPRREREKGLDQTRAEQGFGAVPFAASRAAGFVEADDQLGDFRGVEKGCYVRDDRAPRYFSRCHGSYRSLGHGPGSLRCAGPLLVGFAGQILTRASDSTPSGGPRICVAAGRLIARPEVFTTRPKNGGGATPSDSQLRCKELGWARRDSNPQSLQGTASKAVAFTSFATRPPKLSASGHLGCHDGGSRAVADPCVSAAPDGGSVPMPLTCGQPGGKPDFAGQTRRSVSVYRCLNGQLFPANSDKPARIPPHAAKSVEKRGTVCAQKGNGPGGKTGPFEQVHGGLASVKPEMCDSRPTQNPVAKSFGVQGHKSYPQRGELEFRQTLLSSEIDYQRARRLLAQLAGWEQDRNEPPSLRDGYRCPAAADVDWARAVITLRERAS
jgi:hypothetical protein